MLIEQCSTNFSIDKTLTVAAGNIIYITLNSLGWKSVLFFFLLLNVEW